MEAHAGNHSRQIRASAEGYNQTLMPSGLCLHKPADETFGRVETGTGSRAVFPQLALSDRTAAAAYPLGPSSRLKTTTAGSELPGHLEPLALPLETKLG